MSIRWGIIGCGSVAEHKGGPALAAAEGSELLAVMSRDAGRAQDFAQRHGARRFYTSVADLLADQEVDAVYVATPPHVHAEQTIAAARAGKHVLCEKPMAMNSAQCREMIAICGQAGVMLCVAYYRRYWPIAQRLKALVDEGAVGAPTMARIAVCGLYRPPADGPAPWRTRPETGIGGFLVDIGSHRLDLLAYFLGDVAEVSAFTDTLSFDISVDDSASLLLKFASGAQAVVSCHWNVGAGVDELEVAGPGGRLLASPLDAGRLMLTRGAKTETQELPPPPITHLNLVQEMVAALAGTRENPLSGEQGMVASAVIEAAYRSSAERRAVAVRALLEGADGSAGAARPAD